jgi:acetoin utilization protein AcuB
MKISEVMSSPVVTVLLDDSLLEVKQIFEQSKIRHIIVVEENQLFGVIAERDLLREISPYLQTQIYTPRDLATLNKRVHQAVTRKPIFLHETASICDAINLFKTSHIGCIPVVDDLKKPVGILTRGDVIRHFDEICAAYSKIGE